MLLIVLKLVELVYEVDILKGVINIIIGSVKVIVDIWMEDGCVWKVFFIGLMEIGKELMVSVV